MPPLSDLENLFSLRLLPGVYRLTEAHQQAGQQPDNLCGPYWVALLLRSHGFAVTAEQVAQIAGTVLPVGDPSLWLPAGAPSRQNYSLTLPTTASLKDAGTSAMGLQRAVQKITSGAYALLPVQAAWTGDRLLEVLRLCQDQPHWQVVPLANLRTGHFWGSRLAVSAALGYLNGASIHSPPPADWDVGHFLVLAGLVAGQTRSLTWVCDTYPQFGWQGYHLQPAEAVAAALNRGDGWGGGILLFSAAEHQGEMEQQLSAKGFSLELWDNGSPQP